MHAPRTARRLPLLLLGVTVAGALTGCSLLPGAEPVRDENGSIAERETNADVFSITVGDCTNDGDLDQVEVSSVEAVPCSDPHDNEVFASFDLEDGDFPGAEAVQTLADEGCYDEFEPFVGIAYEESRFAYYPMTPTESSWSQGDREVLCLVFDGELEKVTGSVKGLAE